MPAGEFGSAIQRDGVCLSKVDLYEDVGKEGMLCLMYDHGR